MAATQNPSFLLRINAEIELRKRRKARQLLSQKWSIVEWLINLFPDTFSAGFGNHHLEYWRSVDKIESGVMSTSLFLILGRGGGKTSSAEATPVFLGAKDKRKFCLYVRGVQDRANESIQNIASLLESEMFAQYYPDMAKRKLGKYGNARGWNLRTVRCDNGFSAMGFGLDVAARGVKLENLRPDLIILDDIDSDQDTPKTIEKKTDLIRKAILPAGSSDFVVIGVQNIIHENSIFNQIAKDEADFLIDRKVIGPVPAVYDLEYEQRYDEGLGRRRYFVTGGVASWPAGQSIETAELQINQWGPSAFMTEAQHEVTEKPGGMFSDLVWQHIEFADLPELVKTVVWVDPAITSTDDSDSMGISAAGKDALGRIYKLYSWENITTPEDAIRRALKKAVELKATVVGIETDQGGDTWITVYNTVWKDLIESGEIHPESVRPSMQQSKAGSVGGKIYRGQHMLVDYERGNIWHARGTHQVLERALYRFPKTKPLDLADSDYWAWRYLKGSSVSSEEW